MHLLRDMRAAQQKLSELGDQPDAACAEGDVELDMFLASLRTAGEANPMIKPAPKKARERRRPDPLLAVTAELKA